MVTLHGKEINVGDSVWSLFCGWSKVTEINKTEPYPISTLYNSYTVDGKVLTGHNTPTLFWEEMILTPKPKPVYEWQWLYWSEDRKCYNTTGYYQNDRLPDIFKGEAKPSRRIEESKREVRNDRV